ncbi:helix-turn-helix domain-containing protein [Streptomyces sp. NPDC088707]|uniref:MerR family transcriptional regulator n=1 Tax=Streptomyces sp. NPDC088707 TaxID=3365871 RepID=UPI00382B3202
MQSYTIGQAARLLGVSPDTARRWADAGRVATHRDESGRSVIDGKSLAEFSVEIAQEDLGLEVGMQATARVKSTSVHIDRT